MRNLRGTVHAATLAPLYASLMMGCAGSTEPGTDADLTTTTTSALSASGLKVGGSITMDPMNADDGFAHVFSGPVTVTNQTTKTVNIEKQMFFFAAPGGYAYGPDTTPGWHDPIAPGATAQGGGGWFFTPVVSHVVLRVDGRTSTGSLVAGLGSIPVIAPGHASPGPSPIIDDVNVGVQTPVEILNLTGGERWLEIAGSVIDTTATATAPARVTIRARNSAGGTVATLAHQWAPDVSQVNFPGQPTYGWFVGFTALPSSASVTNIQITATQGISNGPASQTRTIPVVNASPVSIVSPVSGTWFWNNGPGQAAWQHHVGAPEGRYAYDIGLLRLVNGQLVSHTGDPSVNSNYFCWDQPIRAALTGTVVFVRDTTRDNTGHANEQFGPNNEIIIQHPNNLFTRYAHMRQGTATVTKGQTVYAGSVIALVGNAGASSEPHLHFHAFKLDPTGRQAAVPITVPGIRSASGAPLSGIPKAGLMYQTP
jgi:hypothetical protein